MARLLTILCLTLLGSLAPTLSQARTLLDLPQDQAQQAAREQQQMQEQLATQQAWEAQQMAEIQAQQAAEAAKLQAMAEEHAVREAQQIAQQTAEAAEKAAREQAAAVEQAQLAQKAAEAAAAAEQKAAEREARKAARKAKKEARKAAREAEAAAAEIAAAQRVPEEDSSNADSGSDSGAQNGGGGGGGGGGSGSPYSGVTGPIWGMEVGQSDAAKGAPGPVYTTYHYYAPGYETSSLYCADAFAKFLPAKPDTPLLKHPWTAYCNIEGLGPMSQDKCGKCLRVTNPATGQWVKVLVVDLCGQGGIDMDPLGFNAIDGDGAGVRDGHMDTRIEWTSC